MSDPLEARKKALRANLAAAWRSIPAPTLAEVSSKIAEQVRSLPEWQAAGSVLLFMPMPGELEVGPLAHEALRSGKALTVPRTDWNGGTLTPVTVTNWPCAVSRPGRRAPEPPEDARPFPASRLDLVVTPGLGFDAAGRRIGRGAGFYDRFLLENALANRAIGLSPESLLQVLIPAGAMDAPVSIVVTEMRIIRPGRS